MTPTLQRFLPWAIAALLVGTLSGFAFGEAGDGGSATRSTGPSVTSPAEATEPSAAPTQPNGTQPLPCRASTQFAPEPYHAVAGVEGAGAPEIAAVAAVQATTRTFSELNAAATQREFRQLVLEQAAAGPMILVVQLSRGSYQKELAASVLVASPDSAVVVVDQDVVDVPDAAALTDFPERSLLVAPALSESEPLTRQWAEAVHAVVTGSASCPGG